MYFNKNPSPQQSATPSAEATSDFLGFTNNEHPTNLNNSVQLPRYRPSVKHNRWAKIPNNSRSFNDSFSPKNASNNSSFYGENSGFNDSGNNSSFGCNSFNNSFEKRGTFKNYASTGTSFLHPSFMEDPWAELIRKADQRKQEQQHEIYSD